jgi:hypothetical protein
MSTLLPVVEDEDGGTGDGGGTESSTCGDATPAVVVGTSLPTTGFTGSNVSCWTGLELVVEELGCFNTYFFKLYLLMVGGRGS